MKRVLKQWFAALLSVVLVFTLLPATARAEEAGGATETAVEQVQALINALPDAESITAENRADVEAQLTAIDEAKLGLEDEELDELDIARYMAAVEAILALDGMSGAGEPRTIATTESNIPYMEYRGGNYTDGNWISGGASEIKTCSSATKVESDTTTWTEGWYVVKGSVIISERIKTQGNVHLILTDGCTLIATMGISVTKVTNDKHTTYVEQSTLTIHGQSNQTGKLVVLSNPVNCAAIGADEGTTCGEINIIGATVEVTTTNNGGYCIGKTDKKDYISQREGPVRVYRGHLKLKCGNSNGCFGYYVVRNVVESIIEYSESVSCGDKGPGSEDYSDDLYKDTFILSENFGEPRSGIVYGNATLPENYYTVPAGGKLTVRGGGNLSVPHGSTLMVQTGGTLQNDGQITNNGTVDIWGNLEGNGSIAPNPPVDHYKLEVTALSLPDAAYGANTTEQVITIKNVGAEDVTIENVTVDGDFDIVTSNNKTVTKGSQNTSWKIKPKGKLSAGEHKATITVIYNGGRKATAEVTLTVSKAPSNVTKVPVGRTLTFNGSTQALVDAGSASGGTMQYSLSQNGSYSPNIPTGKDAKDYTVWYKVVGDSNHNDTEPVCVNVNINKAPATVTAPTAKNGLTYNGTEQALIDAGSVTSSVPGFGEMQYSLTGSDYSNQVPKARGADTYTVYWKVTTNGNYNYTGAATSGRFTVTIGKAPATVTAPKPKTDLIYNGTEQELITAGSVTSSVPGFGEMQYSLTGSDYSNQVPKARGADTYTVYWKVTTSGNYDCGDNTSGQVTVTINKADSDITADNVTATYGEPITLTAAVKGSDVQGISLMSVPDPDKVKFTFENGTSLEATVTYKDNSRKDSGTATVTIPAAQVKEYLEPGENTVTVSYGGSINLNGKDSATTITVTVNTRTLIYDVTATGRVYAKDNKEVTVALTPNNLVGGDSVTLTAKGTVESADAKTYSSIELSDITMSGTDQRYYTVDSTATSKTSVTIEQKEVTLTWAGDEDFTFGYDGKPHGVTVTVNTGFDETLTAELSNETNTNAGTYTATATGLESGTGNANNYKLPDNVTQEYTITPAPVSFTIGEENKDDWDAKGEANADPNPDGYTLGGGGTDYALSMTYDSYPHKANVAQTEGETVKIEAGTVNGFSVTYKRVKDSAGSSVTEDAKDSVRDAGIYEIWVTINPAESTTDVYNYVFDGHDSVHSLKIGEITVKPFPTAVSWAHLKYVYHGHNMHPEVRVLNSFKADNLQMDSGLPTGFDHEHPEAYTGDYLVAFAETEGSDVGVYTVKAALYGKNAGNYTVTDPTGSVTITPAPVTFTVGDNTWVVREDGALSQDQVTLRPVWGAIAVAPDPEAEATDHQYPLAGSAITDELQTAIKYRDPKTGETVESPTEPGTYEVWVEIGNKNFRHSGVTDGASHNVGELVITNDPDSVKSYTVTFDPGYEDAPDGPADLKGVFANQTVVIPPVSGENADKSTYNIARKGWSFLGWSCNGRTYKPNEEFHMPAGDVTFKAEWIEAVDIGGTVKRGDDESAPVLPGATVTLKQGSEEVAEAVTKEDGTFTFPQVTPGIYNLEIRYHSGDTEIVKTFLVEAGGDDGMPEAYYMPDKALNTVVEVAPGITAAVNLDRITGSQETSEVYTDDDKDIVDQGGKVEFKMSVRGGNLTAEQTEEVPVPADRIGMVLDLELTKTVTPKNGVSKTPEDIHDAKIPVTTVIHLPAELQGKSSYTIYRFHDMSNKGDDDTLEMQTITTSPNSDGEYLKIVRNGTAIEIHAEFYSTYVLTWQQSSGGGISSFPVDLPTETGDGTITSNPTSAIPGSRVTLTVKPDEGHHLGSLTVTDRNGKPVEVTDNGDGTYTFTMPYGQATVKAEFTKCGTLDFTDLDIKAWYHDYTDYVINHGLMRGAGGLFAPDGTVTRAQMVTVLWNMRGKPVVNYYMTYSDVTEDAWYAEAVRWAASEGIVKGYGNGKFGPNDPITREQMAVMLYRYEQKYGDGGFTGEWMYRLPFTDLDRISDWAFEAVAWCNMRGVVTGKGNGVFDPKGPAKRGEMAAILTRYCDGETGEE